MAISSDSRVCGGAPVVFPVPIAPCTLWYCCNCDSKYEFLLPGRVHRLLDALQLRLKSLKNLHVAFQLAWQLAQMLRLERGYLRFLRGHVGSRLLELAFKKAVVFSESCRCALTFSAINSELSSPFTRCADSGVRRKMALKSSIFAWMVGSGNELNFDIATHLFNRIRGTQFARRSRV